MAVAPPGSLGRSPFCPNSPSATSADQDTHITNANIFSTVGVINDIDSHPHLSARESDIGLGFDCVWPKGDLIALWLEARLELKRHPVLWY